MNEGKSGPEIPLWKLERYLIGELPPAEMERIGKLKAQDPEVAAWIKALQAEHADLQASHPTGRMTDGIRDRLNGNPGARRAPRTPHRNGAPTRIGASSRSGRPSLWERLGPGWRIALAPAFALALLLVLKPDRFTGSDAAPADRNGSPEAGGADGVDGGKGSPETTRLKGSLPVLYLFRKADSGAEALRPGSAVRAGDLIQVQYDAAGRKYGAVFSMDGSGKVTWHLPERGNQSAVLSPTGRTALKSAFELDEAPGREDFHFVASDRPFPLDSAADAVVKSFTAGAGGTGFAAPAVPDSQGNRARLAMTHAFFALTKDTLK